MIVFSSPIPKEAINATTFKTLFYVQEFEALEICAKIIFQVELIRDVTANDRDFGMSVEAELAEDSEEEDELCVFIADVIKNGCAYRAGAC